MLTIVIVPAQVIDHEGDGVRRLVDQELLQHILWTQADSRRLTPAGALVVTEITYWDICWGWLAAEAQGSPSSQCPFPSLSPFVLPTQAPALLLYCRALVNAGLLYGVPSTP